MKKLILYFLLLFNILNISVWGETSGDYRSYQTGNWGVAGNWEQYNGSVWNVCTGSNFPALASPWISTKVTIQSGHIITVNSGTAVGGTTGGVLEITAGGTLNMGSYTIRGISTYSTKFPTLTINGTLNTSGYVNSVIFNIGSGGHFITSYSGTRGWWYSSYAPTSVTINGEIQLLGTSLQIIPSYSYNDLILSNSTKTFWNDVTVNGLLTINSGVYLSASGYSLSLNGSGVVVNGTLDVNASILNIDGGTQNISGNGTFGDFIDQINIGATTASNVTLSNPNLLLVNNLTISSGSTFTIGPTSQVDISISLTTNNGLTLKAAQTEPYTSASLRVSDLASVLGNTFVELFLTGGGAYKWHYISSPFIGLAVTNFTSTTSNIAQYKESLIADDKNIGWVKSNGYNYHTTLYENGFGGFLSGRGYDHYYSSDHLYTLSGTLKIATTSPSITFNSGAFFPDYPDTQGFNLLGNPFSSSLDWSQIDHNLPAGVSWAIYFTTGNGTYASWNNGTGTGGGTGTIPPMQGFFVKTANDATVNLVASAKVHSTQVRYKGTSIIKGASIIPLVRLKIDNQTYFDDAVVRFDDKATTGVDNAFDAYKFSKTGVAVGIWTTTGNVDFSINGLPFPTTSIEIPVGISSSVAGSLKISATQIDGLDNYKVTLTDKLNNVTIDLKTTSNLSFDSPSGIVSDRFVLKISNVLTGIPEIKISDKPFNNYYTSGFLNVQTLSDNWAGKLGQIRVIDLTGKLLYVETHQAFSKDEVKQISVNLAIGIYLVECSSGGLRYVSKVIVR